MDDETLIKECVKGNPKAQRMLFDKFAPKMMTVCLRYVKDTFEAEDVLQEGFIKLFNKISDYKMEGSLEGWVRRIMVNTALDSIRKNKKFQLDSTIDDIEFKLSDSISATDELQAEDLMKIIQQMPDGYRMVFNMFAIEGYSHREIGEMLGISENTSKSQFSRAKSYLKTLLEKLEIER
jgi:RNA polymerase sigma factor (sigma-70 family)